MTTQEFSDSLRSLLAIDRSIQIIPGGCGTVFVNFYNLPLARAAERHGGGAECENNRQLFVVRMTVDAGKVKVEQSINGIRNMHGDWAPKMRAKTASYEKIAQYLANYILAIVRDFPPLLTHA